VSEEKRIVELDQYEYRAVVNIINDRRTDLKKEEQDSDFIDEILEKVINAPTKKKSLFKKDKNKDER
jgi:hypothetical protein